ncbi:MAG: serine/threonine-protein kinase [Bryobacteraceae bacterium]
MSPEIARLLESVSQTPSAGRAEFLERECPDPEIRAEVESLLPFYTRSESWIAPALEEMGRSMHGTPELSPGDLVGAYRIVSLIGVGGMGAVYLATRMDGAFEQDVAIKVVPSANASFLLERFERERRILALLNHPNIARILDGGHAPNGLPYLAMEYVAGEPVDAFCEERALSLRDRLKLFLKVCDAVGHAHGRLVVHRDLKPANVLVTAAGEPKLLDFGIAKVLDPSHAETGSTRLMTPEYASPEQVRGEPVTTASDIYSLGALLYKVLTGFTPHDLENKSPLEAARIISERPVQPASSVSPGIPADVSAILQKALHNDPGRRYAFVSDLSLDIRRFLDQRPVLAAPDTFVYRARRFLRRNALVSAIAATAMLSLLAGSALTVYQGRRAQRRFDQVRQLAHVFLFDFDRSIQDKAGTLEARKLIAATAQQYLRQLRAESGGDAQLEREIAESYQRLGDIQAQLLSGGERDMGIASTREAYEIRKRLGDDRSDDAGRRRDFIQLASTLADRYQQTRNAKEAAVWAHEAVRLAESWVKAEPRRPEALEAARTAFVNEGLRLETAGQSERAREYMDKGVGFGERARAVDPENGKGDVGLANAQFTLANMLLTLKRAPEALPHAQRGLALMEAFERHDLANQRAHRVYGLTLSTAGMTYEMLAEKDPSQLSVAAGYLKRAHLVASGMARADPKDSRAKDDLIVQNHRYARVLRTAKRRDEAALLYDEAGAAARDLTAEAPQNRRNWYLWAANQVNYGEMRLEQGRAAEAETILQSADPPMLRALEFDPDDATILELRASQLGSLAEAAEKRRDHARAQQKMRECLNVVTDMIRRDPSVRDYIGEYDEILALARRLDVPTDLR